MATTMAAGTVAPARGSWGDVTFAGLDRLPRDAVRHGAGDPMRALSLLCCLVAAACSAEEEGMKLVWSDEFDRDGLPDPAKWDYEVGLVRNGEKQWYTKARAENARVEGGNLVITARKEPFEKAQYTSASLHTRGTFTFTYGKVEVRAKLPGGRGSWPAIWMLGANIGEVGWPMCGEIDIMEHVGFDPDQVHFTVHTKAFNHTRGTGVGKGVRLAAPHQDFHVYGMEWDPKEIRFFLDGKQVHQFADDGKGPEHWPFNAPQYLLINLAIGGGWGGQKGIDDAIFPNTYLVDWVRIYQKP